MYKFTVRDLLSCSDLIFVFETDMINQQANDVLVFPVYYSCPDSN